MSDKKLFEKEFINSGGSTCPFCGKALWLRDYQEMENSIRRHILRRKIKCDHCQKEFRGIYKLSSSDVLE